MTVTIPSAGAGGNTIIAARSASKGSVGGTPARGDAVGSRGAILAIGRCSLPGEARLLQARNGGCSLSWRRSTSPLHTSSTAPIPTIATDECG
jgi:hypothetical protein